MSQTSARKDKLLSLEAGRGVAASLVVAVHAWDHLFQAYGWFPFGALFAFGHAGVDFFFVLSGFIIHHVHARDIGRPSQLAHYAERRFTRIYPFYWAMLVLALVAAALLRSHAFPSLGVIASSALLLPGFAVPIIGVAWTLQNEVAFYAVFAILILDRRAGCLILGTWLVALLVVPLAAPALPGLAGWMTSYFDFHFFFGMAAAGLLACRSVPRPLTLLLVSAIGFLAVGLAEDAHLFYGPGILPHLGYALASTGAVLGLVEAERQARLVVPRPLVLLGSASYSIYLTHLLAIGVAWQALLATGLTARLSGWLTFLILIAGGILAGVLMSAVVEKPITRFVRRHMKNCRLTPETG